MKLADLFIVLGLKKDGFDKGVDDAKQKTGGLGGAFKGLATTATAVWGAIGVGAVMAFNKIKNSSDTLSTKWDIMIGGMTGATNEFFRTLAIGDWSNFIDNMKEAVRVGREYVEMLDQLEEMQRAGTMAEAKMLKQNTQLEIDAADVTKSVEVRKAAAEQRIANEEKLGKIREDIARKAYENEKMITMQQTRLSGDAVERMISDFDSLDKVKAKKINEYYDKLKQHVAFSGTDQGQKIIENQLLNGFQLPTGTPGFYEKIEPFTQAEVDYAKALRQMGDTTDEQLNKMVDSYMKLSQAQESVIGNTRRIRIRLSGLISGEEKRDTEKEITGIKNLEKELSQLSKGSIAYSQTEISLLESKRDLITDPHLLAQAQKEIEVKKDLLSQMTKELVLLEQKKLKTKDIRELGYFKENRNDRKGAGQLDMGGSMKSGIQMSEDSIDAYEDQVNKAKQFTKDLNTILASGLSEASNTMFTGFGEMLGSGDWDWSNFGSQLLDTVGKFMQTLGGLFLTMGIGMIKFNASLKGMNGIGMIAAGGLLIAAGAAISSVASQGMKGAGASGASVASSYGSYSGGSSNGIKVEVGGSFELEGTKLRAAIHNTERRNNLIR